MVKGRQGERVRLYVRGTILGYKRSKSNQYPNTSLIQIEGVNTTEEVTWYKGKRMAYIYKAKTKKNGSHYRCIWGKVTRPHGNSGVVRAKFTSNLPPKSMGMRNLIALAREAKKQSLCSGLYICLVSGRPEKQSFVLESICNIYPQVGGSLDRAQPRFVHNEPGRFDCRFTSVTIKDCPSIVLKGMEGNSRRTRNAGRLRKLVESVVEDVPEC
ncbi:hypothetical protein F2Q70_00016062 [Brassica cretica]|uniref:60S ribosomal protein L35a n=2 Tax=Brassica TaxID=3705 RepID=A0A8S9HYF0_BRACR|nr:hypothetical protein F2Q70_00016062 [Brassica cretica]